MLKGKSKKLTARGKGPGYQKSIDSTYIAKHPERKKARNKLTNAVRDKKIKRPKGKEFHHTDYGNKKGTWMEKGKHRKVKRKRR